MRVRDETLTRRQGIEAVHRKVAIYEDTEEQWREDQREPQSAMKPEGERLLPGDACDVGAEGCARPLQCVPHSSHIPPPGSRYGAGGPCDADRRAIACSTSSRITAIWNGFWITAIAASASS